MVLVRRSSTRTGTEVVFLTFKNALYMQVEVRTASYKGIEC